VIQLNTEELKRFLEKQIAIEKDIVARIEENTKYTKDLLIKERILGIAYDSLRHANMLSGLLALLTSKMPLISELEQKAFVDGI